MAEITASEKARLDGLEGKSGGTTLIGGKLTAQTLILKANEVDSTTVTIAGATNQLIQAAASRVGALFVTSKNTSTANATDNAGFYAEANNAGASALYSAQALGSGAFWSWGADGADFRINNGTSIAAQAILSITNINANVLIGTLTDVAGTKFRVDVSKSIASAPSAVWDGSDHIAATATLLLANNITTATGFNAHVFRAPTISAASALTVTNASTVVITGAPSGAGAGPASITNALSLWVQAGTSVLPTIAGSNLTGQSLVLRANLVDVVTTTLTSTALGGAPGVTISTGVASNTKSVLELQGSRAADGSSFAEVLAYHGATQVAGFNFLRANGGAAADFNVFTGGTSRYTITYLGEHQLKLPAITSTSAWVKLTSATATNRHRRIGARSATTWSDSYNLGFDGTTNTTDDNAVTTWEVNYDLAATKANQSINWVSGTAATNPTRTSVMSLSGEGQLILAGGNINAARRLIVSNDDGGTGTFISVDVRNTGSDVNSGVRLLCTGTGFSASGAFFQDGAVLDAGSALAGGLSIVAHHATTGELRFYTGGQNLRMTVDAAGPHVGIGITPTSNYTLRTSKSGNGVNITMSVENSSNTANSHARHVVQVGGTSAGDPYTNWTGGGALDWCAGLDNSDGDAFKISQSSGLGTNDYLTITTLKSFIVGSGAIATNATDGFLYVPACAGAPTGVPTGFTGRIPIVVDSTNNKAYIYSGGNWVALN